MSTSHDAADNLDAERSRLAGIAADSWYAKGPNETTIRHSASIFRRMWRGRSALELGPAEGVMTEYLAVDFAELTIVEGAEAFCEPLRLRYPRATVIHSLFEDWDTPNRFDAVVVSHVLEHVADPVDIVKRARSWLAPGGSLFASVPNARSLHRQAAVIMGILAEEHALNEADLHHGHRRVFDPESFRAVFTDAGMKITAFGGYWLKPVSNGQIESDWTPKMLEAFMHLGERYPDIAGEIYVVAGA